MNRNPRHFSLRMIPRLTPMLGFLGIPPLITDAPYDPNRPIPETPDHASGVKSHRGGAGASPRDTSLAAVVLLPETVFGTALAAKSVPSRGRGPHRDKQNKLDHTAASA